MGKIFCLMGKSSTGKDTIYKRLLGDQELGLQRIVPYTTRPIREGEPGGSRISFCQRGDTAATGRGRPRGGTSGL